jgi:hypothetical protein
VLANLIEKTFSIEYKQREIEEKARPLKLAPIPTQKPALNQSETEGMHNKYIQYHTTNSIM